MIELASIDNIYRPSITEGNAPKVVYLSPIERIGELTKNLAEIVKRKIYDDGLCGVSPIDLNPEQTNKLRREIKEDVEWQKVFEEIIDSTLGEYDRNRCIEAINTPWWNSVLLFREDDEYNGSDLVITAKALHSYVAQIIRSGLLRNDLDPVSISNILITNDGFVVLGYRGGHTYSDTVMTIPAGSVECFGENPLFNSLYSEFSEEIGLSGEDIGDIELIGKVKDHTIAHNTLFVFRSYTRLDFVELLDSWKQSIDRKEHRSLIPLSDDPTIVLDYIKSNRFIYRTGTDNRITIPENVSSVLPPCVASILTHYIHREGIEWGKAAEKALDGFYKLNI